MPPKGYETVSSEDKEDKATAQPVSIFSILTFRWLNNVIKTGSERVLDTSDLLSLNEETTTRHLTESFESSWKNEAKHCNKQDRRPKLWKCAFKIISLQSGFFIGLAGFLDSVCRILQALFIGFLLSALVSSKEPHKDVLLYGCAAAMAVNSWVRSLCMHYVSYRTEVLGISLSSAIKGVVYNKILLLSKQCLVEFTTGHVIDLVSNDVQRLEEAPRWCLRILQAIVDTIMVPLLMLYLVGWQALMGLIFLFFLVPYFAGLSSVNALLRLRTATVSDQRISLMNEMVSGIRQIKANAHEDKCRETINGTRRNEIDIIRLKSLVLSAMTAFLHTSASVAAIISIFTFVYTDTHVTPVNAFMLLCFLGIIRMSVGAYLGNGLMALFEAYASLQRIEEFLLLDTLPSLTIDHYQKWPRKMPAIETNLTSDDSTHILDKKSLFNIYEENGGNGNVSVPKMTPSPLSVLGLTYMPNGKSILHNINLSVKASSLTVITGPVGCGKSMLLSAIVGEVAPTSGTIHCHGTLVFLPQTPWIFSGTIKENILFGEAENAMRYRKVIESCALKEDIERFPEYDQTIVGERGVVLSGGQRARVSLARAVYAEADTFIIDDPLSAVDMKVGEHIFEKCIMGLLRDKTRIVTSHQENHMRAADHIVVLSKHGMLERESLTELKERNLVRSVSDPEIKTKTEQMKPNERSAKQSTSDDKDTDLSDLLKGLEIAQEDRAIGKVSYKLYWNYWKSGMHSLVIGAIACLFLFTQVIFVSCDVWLSYLTKQDQRNQQDKMNFMVYGALVSASVIFALIRACVFLLMSLQCSQRLHDKMIVAVLKAPVLFFDLNPIGRVLNRFSKDIGCVDELLPKTFLEAIQQSLFFLAAAIVPVIANPWLTLVLGPLTMACVYIVRYYLKTARELKRIESITRSPVFSHISETLNGLDTIRTRGKQKDFINQLYSYQDTHTQSFIMVVATGRWLGVRLDLLCGFFTGAVALAAVFLSQDVALVGLALVYVIETIDGAQFAVRQSSQVENLMTSVERVLTYTTLDSEPGYGMETLPPKQWPSEGNISFRNVSLAYYQGGRHVLRNMNANIKGKAKIGVVGRTGAGKSSFVAALLRMPDADGDIIVDGVRLNAINLQESRRCISVLSQSPFLFSGTIRKNLDPMSKHEDLELWSALEDVQLKTMVEKLDGQLENELLEQGANLSVGERQLMCLARVLLQRNKIIILDEPTAFVDPHTEQTIWKTVREKMTHSTVITIAHRLNTVKDCDKVFFFRQGKAIEYETIDTLLAGEGSVTGGREFIGKFNGQRSPIG